MVWALWVARMMPLVSIYRCFQRKNTYFPKMYNGFSLETRVLPSEGALRGSFGPPMGGLAPWYRQGALLGGKRGGKRGTLGELYGGQGAPSTVKHV